MITVQAIIKTSIEKAWEFWTLPEHIVKWNNASDDWHRTYAENDLKVGGKFKCTMASKDGSMSFDFEGIYTHCLLSTSPSPRDQRGRRMPSFA